jgi:hypothetical protein
MIDAILSIRMREALKKEGVQIHFAEFSDIRI